MCDSDSTIHESSLKVFHIVRTGVDLLVVKGNALVTNELSTPRHPEYKFLHIYACDRARV